MFNIIKEQQPYDEQANRVLAALSKGLAEPIMPSGWKSKFLALLQYTDLIRPSFTILKLQKTHAFKNLLTLLLKPTTRLSCSTPLTKTGAGTSLFISVSRLLLLSSTKKMVLLLFLSTSLIILRLRVSSLFLTYAQATLLKTKRFNRMLLNILKLN